MKLRSAPILGCVTLLVTLAMDVKCDYKDALGGGLLDGLWYMAAVGASDEGDGQLQSQIDELNSEVDQLADDVQEGQQQPGVPGAQGDPGLSCWDLNGNGEPDEDEDVNEDGVWDALDCSGTNGTNGDPGTPGANCWDDIGDFNEDGELNSYDCLDYVQAGGDDVVIARGFIDSFGTLVSGTNVVSASWAAVGEYSVVIDLSTAKVDLQDAGLLPEHFPVLLTVYATSADPLPWSDNIGALVAHYKFEDATSLDRVNQTLTMRIFILQTQDGVQTGANFSVMVLEP